VRATFFTIWDGSIRWFMENMQAYQYNQQVRDSGLIDPAVTAETARYLDYFFIAIQKGFTQGSIKPYPLELICGILYQDIVAIMNIVMVTTDPAQQEEAIQSGFEIFWAGIKAED
jgi:hypothetical protein